MKKKIFSILVIIACFTANSYAQNQKEGLKNLFGNAVENVVNKVTDKITNLSYESLEGTWMYANPACEFESENVLKEAGAEIIASQIESKLKTIYDKAGISSSSFGYTFANDSTFSTLYKSRKLNGSFTIDEKEKTINMNYQLAGLINIGKSDAKVIQSQNKIILLFDAGKLVKLINTISLASKNTTVKTVNSILNSYEGVLIGFELIKK